MAQDVQRETRYRWIGISVAAIALLGWLLALYSWSVSSELENELERQVALSGDADELEALLVSLQTETARAETVRDERLGDLDHLNRQLNDIREQIASSEARAQTLQGEREALEVALADRSDEQARLEGVIDEARQRVAETSQELADVGARLEEARQQEADLQLRVVGLTSDVERLTESAAGAESRVQEAREAEASLEQQVLAARQGLEEVETTRSTLEQSIETLVQRRDQLASETAAAETQMQQIQQQIVQLSRELATRSERLVELEANIADQQQEASQPARAAAAGLILGERYEHDGVTAIFVDDGTFEMTNADNKETVVGNYSLAEGLLTLTEASGDLRGAEFPMRCTIVAEALGFRLEDEDGSCKLLSGISFVLIR
nr:hypothetical protein [Paracoccus saliphilus]